MKVHMTGADVLREHAATAFIKECVKVGTRTYHYKGYGHSNVIAIEARDSVILIDALDSPDELDVVLKDIARRIGKPVGTLIYTHGHPDHRGGAGRLRGQVEEVIAFAPCKSQLADYGAIDRALANRGRYQHGYGLSDEEAICQGIGPREGKELGLSGYDLLPPTTVYSDIDLTELEGLGARGVHRAIDGVELDLVAAPGETDDALMIWLQDERVLVCGDVYYACWPNLYAIRGTHYRDVSQWVKTLEVILSLGPHALLPGHLGVILGADEVKDRVGMLRDAIKWVLRETLACINRGLTLGETVRAVVLPDEYRQSPFLRELYGTVEWSVKSIYTGYVGWFDGDPVALMPSPRGDIISELRSLIGEERILKRVVCLAERGDYQLALELMALLPKPERGLREGCLRGRAEQMTSANARHFLMACARFGELSPIEQ